jgi:hypothetical protein
MQLAARRRGAAGVGTHALIQDPGRFRRAWGWPSSTSSTASACAQRLALRKKGDRAARTS